MKKLAVTIALLAAAAAGSATSAGLAANAASPSNRWTIPGYCWVDGAFVHTVTRPVPGTNYQELHDRQIGVELDRCKDGFRTWKRSFGPWGAPYPNTGWYIPG